MQPISAAAPHDWRIPGFRAEVDGLDFVSDDGKCVVEMKLGAQGTRDLHGAMMQLALYLKRHPGVREGIVVIRFPRMTVESARDAWTSAKGLLTATVREKLGVVVLLPNEPFVWSDPETPRVATVTRAVAHMHGQPTRSKTETSIPTSRKFFDAWKVLLCGWLRREPPMSAKQAAAIAGCSYPMMIRFVSFLHERRELLPGDMSKLELRGFPRTTFEQAVGLADGLRRTVWFADVSGAVEPSALLRRLRRAHPRNVAVGGVHAARVLDRAFDLHGSPRLDLVQWVPMRSLDNLAFVKKLDPSLRPTRTKDGAVVAVHRLTRARSLFSADPERGAIADPVEVLLDLHELRLGAQAEALIERMRGKP